MARYYFDVFDRVVSLDDVGTELPDLPAVRVQVRDTLTELAQQVSAERDATQYRVDVRDERDRRILTASLLMVIEKT